MDKKKLTLQLNIMQRRKVRHNTQITNEPVDETYTNY